MALIPQENVLADLQGFLPFIRKSVYVAWGDWERIPIEIRVNMCSRTRASAVHNFFVFACGKLIPEAKPLDLSKLKVFCLGKYAFRFKKFDDDLRSSNQPTKQVRDFQGQLQLPGIESACNLEVGYRLDTLEQMVESVFIVCPNGKQRFWEMEIRENNVSVITKDIFDNKEIAAPDEQKSKFRTKNNNNVVPLRVTNDERDN